MGKFGSIPDRTRQGLGRALANRCPRGDGMTEFYVGYLPKAPSGIARKMKVVIVVLFAAATTCAIGFAALQRTYARSFFESGKERTFEGVIEAGPYPTLLSSPDAANGSALRYLLVAKESMVLIAKWLPTLARACGYEER